jgi:hypothetical protein
VTTRVEGFPLDSALLQRAAPLYAQLEQRASQRGETVSQVARTLIIDGLARQQNPDRDALDAAIAALQKLRRDMPAVSEAKPARQQRKKAS